MKAPPVRDLCAFVPSRDFELSTRFYEDLGFHVLNRDADFRDLQIGSHRFILQDFYVEEHANNYMIFLLVEDVDGWWTHIRESGILDRYESVSVDPPKLRPWGLKVLILRDPAGVLWHIAQVP